MSAPDRLSATDTGRGPAVVLVHGLSETGDAWRFQIEALARGFRVIACDVRGHGQSPTGEGLGTPEQLAADVAALMAARSIERAHVVGFSMGGVIGQRLAIDHPHLVSSLVLVASSSKCNDAANQFFLDRIRTGETEGLPGVRAVNEADAPGCFATGAADVVAAYVALRVSAIRDPAGYVNACRAMRTMHERPLIPELDRIRVPTLVIAGGRDAYCPPRASAMIADRIAGAQLRVFPENGHCLHWESPQAFNAALASFLAAASR